MPRRQSQLAALFKMNARDFLRNRTAALMSFALPLLFVIVFGVTSSGSAPRALRLAVVDVAHDDRSAELIRQLDASDLVEVRRLDSKASIAAYRAGEVDASLVVPRDAFAGGRCPPGDDFNCKLVLYASAGTAAMLEPMLAASAANLSLDRSGLPPAFVYRSVAPEQATGIFIFILPGIIALALLQLGLMGTATPLMVARDSGTLAHLASTPVSPLVMLGAQLLLRLAIGMLQIGSILTIGVLAFHVKLAHPLLALPVIVLGAAMMIAIGYAIAGLAPSREAGHGLVMLINFTMIFLGGVFFAPSGVMTTLSKLAPISYLADAIRELALGAGGALPLGVNLLAMVVFTALAVALAVKTFRFDMKETR